MIRRPPRSTLFPYTTALPIFHGDDFVPFNEALFIKEPGLGASVAWHRDGTTHWDAPDWDEGMHGFKDRKSTRLNSSHANISYAVFCLKKKNIKHPVTQYQLSH